MVDPASVTECSWPSLDLRVAGAIRALELAVADDESRLPDVKGKPDPEDETVEDADALTLRQHAWPLIEMLKQAYAADEVIAWGV